MSWRAPPALVLIVSRDATGRCRATVQLVVPPTPLDTWHAFAPCAATERGIAPTMPVSSDWLLTDGWWSTLDDGRDLWAMVDRFGAMRVCDLSPRGGPRRSSADALRRSQ